MIDATKAQRISEKFDACQLFLVHMAESRGDWPKFGAYLSAFLSAYRAIFWRLIRAAKGGPFELHVLRSVKQVSGMNPIIGFLKNARDVEDHEFGVEYFMNVVFSAAYVPKSRFTPRPSGRFHRAHSRFPAIREFHEFLAFKDQPHRDMIELCANGLDEARIFVYQTLQEISEADAA